MVRHRLQLDARVHDRRLPRLLGKSPARSGSFPSRVDEFLPRHALLGNEAWHELTGNPKGNEI